jgi:preprotein translocase subunit SecG
MENLHAILLVAQVMLSISLIALVLLQHGKGADAGAAFGSGASATVFGAKGSGNFLTRATTIIAMLFFATCLSLAYLAGNREGPRSVIDSVVETQTLEAPAMGQNSTILKQPENVDLPPADSSPASGSQSNESNGGDLPPADK